MILLIFQGAFVLLMAFLMLILLFELLLAWSWAQSEKPNCSLTEWISIAAIEWGAVVSILPCYLFKTSRYFETPPVRLNVATQRQIPVIFIPSLHSGASIFYLLLWRLKQNYFKSLWPFQWTSFLKDPILLKFELASYIDEVLKRTESPFYFVVSFGSSRPILAQLFQDDPRCQKWVCISGGQRLSAPLKLLKTTRLKQTELMGYSGRLPEITIYGEHDLLIYPTSLFGEGPSICVPQVGHMGTLLHSKTVQSIIEEFNRV